MNTQVTQAKATKRAIQFPKTLECLNKFRANKNMSQSEADGLLNNAYKECEALKEMTMFRRVLLHIGDVSRQHEILKVMKIKSETGGAQERSNFRKILNWWSRNMEQSFVENLRVFTQFTVYENLMFYQITSDRYRGDIKNVEKHLLKPEAVHKYLASQINKKRDLGLIARHLPALKTGTYRTAKKTISLRKGIEGPIKWSFPENRDKNFWLKVNGESVDLEGKEFIMVEESDILSFPRKKQNETLEKQREVNSWIQDFCKVMGWEGSDYIKFRKNNQHTPEQVFSNKTVLTFSEEQLTKMFDTMTAGQRYRVNRMLVDKKGSLSEPSSKWGQVSKVYAKWELEQNQAAKEVRIALESGDESKVKEASKKLKVKSTGKQTVELVADLFGSRDLEFINTTYTSLVSKLDLQVNVFPVIDGSGSMDGTWGNCNTVINGVTLTPRMIAYTLGITFSTLNPQLEMRNAYGWFSEEFHIVGSTKFKDFTPNPYMNRRGFQKQVSTGLYISAEKTLSENLAIMKASDPGEVAGTNLWGVIDFFSSRIEQGLLHSEDAPNCLLFLTDTEGNVGSDVETAFTRATSVGWNPLVVMWNIGYTSYMNDFAKNIPNLLFVNGFSESVLSQVLRGIKTGSVNPDDELYSIKEDKRYSVIS